MSEVLKCSSCGGSNRLPEGKTSMFCAFCGNSIEKKTTIQQNSGTIKWPKIIKSEKKEVPFEELSELRIKKMVYEDLRKGGIVNQGIFKKFEHQGTTDGYNVRPIFSRHVSGTTFIDEKGEWEFVKKEYDTENFTAKLNLSNFNIKSFDEIFNHYDSDDLRIVTHLNLSGNKITSYEGVEKFYHLKFLDLSNNSLIEFPKKWPEQFDKEIGGTWLIIEELNLANNKIKKINSHYPFHVSTLIKIEGNELDDLPNKVKVMGETEFIFKLTENGEIDLEATPEFKAQKKKEEESNFRKCKKCSKKITKETYEENKGNCSSCNKGKCFIATTVMGSYDHPQVVELRHFRDEWILTKNWGYSFVKWYYHYGEKAAKVIDKSFALKKLSYLLIVKPLVYLSRIVKR